MIDQLDKPLLKALYVLDTSKKQGTSKLSPKQISDILLEDYEIDLSERAIINALNPAKKGVVKVHKDLAGGETHFEILRDGKKLLATELGKPLPVNLAECSIPEELRERLGEEFEDELRELTIADLNDCGLCQAFLLRKILEKLLVKCLSKQGLSSQIYDQTNRLINLSSLLKLAQSHKVAGNPILFPRTAKAIKGAKFLGDTAAHNPFYTVDSETVNKQMPYIITALGELSRWL